MQDTSSALTSTKATNSVNDNHTIHNVLLKHKTSTNNQHDLFNFLLDSHNANHIAKLNSITHQISNDNIKNRFNDENINATYLDWLGKLRISNTFRPHFLILLKNMINILNNLLTPDHHTFNQFRQRKLFVRNVIIWTQTITKASTTSQSPLICILPQTQFLWGVAVLTTVHEKHRNNHRIKKWLTRFREENLTPQTYTWWRFTHTHVVYVKMNLDTNHSYIGMTTVGTKKREQSRKQKSNQVKNGKFVSCEPAIRFWQATQTSHRYIPLIIKTGTSKTWALATEAKYITKWKPSLNTPFINQFFKQSSEGRTKSFSFKQQLYKASFKRLWQKVRRRMKTLQQPWRDNTFQPELYHNTAEFNAWITLFKLSQQNLDRYLTIRTLRSKTTSDTSLYALWRQAQHLEEPHKGRTLSQLRLIFKYRSLNIPRHNLPLIIPQLAHLTFKKNLQQWIKQLTTFHKNRLLPFHIPSTEPVFAKHQPLSQLLHTWKTIAQKKHEILTTECPCKNFLQKYPRTKTTNGHVMAAGTEIPDLPHHLQEILQSSSKDTVYQSKTPYLNLTTQKIKQWSQHHSFPIDISEKWTDFVEQQWPLHLQEVSKRNYHNFKHIAQLRIILQRFIIQCEDHAPTKLCVYCPKAYLDLHNKTMTDPTIFKVHKDTPTNVQATILNNFPQELKRRYKWG